MNEFNPEDFREAIDDMCDDAIRRMFAIQEGGLVTMLPGDLYASEDMDRNDRLDVIEFNTHLRTTVIDGIHCEVIEQSAPDYAVEILSGAVIALARHASYRGRGSTVLVPSHEMARSHISERMLMRQQDIDSGGPLSLYAHELGSLGLVSLTLERRGSIDWTLSYDSNRRTALIRY